MSKRHSLNPLDWESVFGRLEELVMANSGEDAFSEIFKLIAANLAYESSGDRPFFLSGATPDESVRNLNFWLAAAERKWPQILDQDIFTRLSPDQVHSCLLELERVSLEDTHLEVLDGLFEHLVSQTQKGSKGQFFTPRTVIDAIVQMVGPKYGERILDPACGSGGFLTHAHRFVMETSPSDKKNVPPPIYGYDLDPKTTRVSKAMNLIIGGDPKNIVRLNSLLTPSSGEALFRVAPEDDVLTIEDVERSRGNTDGLFDVIITNPPFAGEVTGHSLLAPYDLARQDKRNERDALFLERCVRLLRPYGRLAIVMPSGRTGSKQSSFVRDWLMKRLRIVSVLSLDRNTFRPHTTQKADVIFGYRRPETVTAEQYKDEEILFLTSENSGKDSRGQVITSKNPSGTSLWERTDHDLAEGVGMFKSFIKEHGIDWGN